MNISAVHLILKELYRQGLREVVMCPGSRNAPFVEYLSESKLFRIHYFFDERAAGFFALGRAKALKQPVAVITTSGTAVANLLPSCVEAFHSTIPLVFITADRPKALRHTGAPQTIHQSEMLSAFCERAFDFEAHEWIKKEAPLVGPLKGPWHFNVCFGEPLIDEDILSMIGDILEDEPSESVNSVGQYLESDTQVDSNSAHTDRDLSVLSPNFFEAMTLPKKALIVVGGLRPDEQNSAKYILQKLGWPAFIEGSSGLRESPELKRLAIIGGERSCAKFVKDNQIEFILRIGGVPTLRLWRELDSRAICHLSWGEHQFSGSATGELVSKPLAVLANYLKLQTGSGLEKNTQVFSPEVFAADRNSAQELERLFEKYPRSEPALFNAISARLRGNYVYVGNSLPIRQWDLAASREKEIVVWANRGANGIDGQFASAVGQGYDDKIVNIILGDLTMLYDLNSLSCVQKLKPEQILNLFVINNSGGQIFSRLYKNPNYINSHTLNFQGAALMFGLNYYAVRRAEELNESASKNLIEVVPDLVETKEFWGEWTTQ